MTCPHCAEVEARATAAGQRNMQALGTLALVERERDAFREALEAIAVDAGVGMPRTVTSFRMRMRTIYERATSVLREAE